jgi:flotillin
LDFESGPIVAAVAVALAFVMLVALFLRNYVKVPPNQVAVFSGRGQPTIVRGGGRFKLPGIQRVDIMNIEPFKVDVDIKNAVSSEGVPVSVGAVALVRFGSAEETIATAVERFLTSEDVTMMEQAREIVSGNLRGIIANMTVEELNASREELSRRVVEEAESSFGRIGMELEVLTIQTIADEKGYLEALGRKRVAEVVRDAEIGEAEAARDSMIRSAEARRLGQTASAEADAAVAQANRDRDLRIAEYTGEVAAQQKKAEQAGPLAQALAQKAVAVAEEQTNAARQEAAIQVERQRALREEQSQEALVVVPAAAKRKAAELEAEAGKIKIVKGAEGDSERVKLLAAGDAERVKLLADAHREELFAQAAGEQAGLEAEAAGKKELAEALNAFSDAAMRLQMYPELIKALPEVATALGQSYAQIDRYVVIDAGGNGDDSTLGKIIAGVPAGVAAVLETMRAATGVDLAHLAGTGGNAGAEKKPDSQDGVVEDTQEPLGTL